ncbi:metalloregulator ArsR/SmtB family transcription factor [Brachybacterium sp. JHP9]|uniref:Metalloregulator ArsR/SmtB family transcription factor n=1 Tax=Brachybacterium equifaecis TaxID=2910770 RepID=A0ABT0QZJ1_9MICO|nr:metalloregulator ArsR/SmtB family transcription factor [Brachybacterium equifaecis]
MNATDPQHAVEPTASPEPAGPAAPVEPTEPQLASAADTFALLASPARLHLVWLMTSGTYDVGALAERVGLSLPTTSQHLGRLRLAGLVSARREGRRSFYSVDDPHVVRLVEQIFEHIAPDGTLAPDPLEKA